MWKRTVCLSGMLLLVEFPCLPKLELRSLTGVVTDKRGNGLRGAVVQLEDATTLSIRSYISDGAGRYCFKALNSDIDYILQAKYRSYWSKSKTLSKFNSSKHPTVDLVIPIE